MLKKKLAVTIASVAVASFILGTMFNFSLITTAKVDDDPMPVWPMYITGVNATALPEAWNVTVTNWPVSSHVNVWWQEYIDGTSVHSLLYNANGFGQLHVLMYEYGLVGTETVHIWIYGVMRNPAHTEKKVSIVAEQVTLSGANAHAAITIPVPSEEFWFFAITMYECELTLSFYLTWA